MTTDPFGLTTGQESAVLELKRATGRDGRGELPASFFESYSAMANSYGGKIMLGVDQSDRGTSFVGIEDTAKVLKALWDGLNDAKRVSANLLSDHHVELVAARHDRSVIVVTVPKAPRAARPVFVGRNPFEGTYRRNHEGDYLCDPETVRRMFVEQAQDARDGQLLPTFGLNDIDATTLNSYRQQFEHTQPAHPWNVDDSKEFLRAIGAWGLDRERGTSGLTLAGLLMFGKLRSILDELPSYGLDYRRVSELENVATWKVRVATDGSWSGNLYDFFQTVLQEIETHLGQSFRIPVQREFSGVRRAVTEALVNCLVHADYSASRSIQIVQSENSIVLSNPGAMRLSIEEALSGGHSDCRNPAIQTMFRLLGLGDRAGAGIPRIFHQWRQHDWRAPELRESLDPDRTKLTLSTVSLFPLELLEELDRKYGAGLEAMPTSQRRVLALTHMEGIVSHRRLKDVCGLSSSELSKTLHTLVLNGYLESRGLGSGTQYFPYGEAPSELPSEDEDFRILQSVRNGGSQLIHDDGTKGGDNTDPAQHDSGSADEVFNLRQTFLIAFVARSKHVPRSSLQMAVLYMCSQRFVSLDELAGTLNRDAASLQHRILKPLVREGRLELKFPNSLRHPEQAYRRTV